MRSNRKNKYRMGDEAEQKGSDVGCTDQRMNVSAALKIFLRNGLAEEASPDGIRSGKAGIESVYLHANTR